MLLPSAGQPSAGPAKLGSCSPLPVRVSFCPTPATQASSLCLITFLCDWLRANYSPSTFALEQC